MFSVDMLRCIIWSAYSWLCTHKSGNSTLYGYFTSTSLSFVCMLFSFLYPKEVIRQSDWRNVPEKPGFELIIWFIVHSINIHSKTILRKDPILSTFWVMSFKNHMYILLYLYFGLHSFCYTAHTPSMQKIQTLAMWKKQVYNHFPHISILKIWSYLT